jgi:Holliday junction DNA helicase RuvA
MIASLAGKVIFQGNRFIILDVNGVGYKVFLSQNTLSKIPKKQESLKVFCFQDVRQNNLDLYGFLNQKDLEFFEFLDEIPSVGPKSALEIAHLGPLERVKEAIAKNNKKVLNEIFSVGKKKGQRIILEISREIKKVKQKKEILEDEASQALKNLGFSSKDAKEALSRVPKDIKETEQRIKIALKFLGK